jgi:hypothetical protein
MGSRPFANADPLLQLIVLFVLAFFCLGVFMLMAQGVLNALWGVNLFESPGTISDYENPQVVQMNRVLLLFQHLGLFVVPAVVFAKLSSTSWRRFVGFRYALPQFLIGSVVIMVVALPLINALAWFNEGIEFPNALKGLEDLFIGMEESAMELTNALARTDHFGFFLFNILVVAVLPAFGEEMIFRGLVLPMFRRWTGNVHAAVWLSALLFSAMHLQFFGFLPRLVLGALLGYLFVWSKTLWVPVLAHFTNNALALFLMFLIARGSIPEEVESFEPSSYDWLWTVGSIIGLVLCIAYFLRYAKGWKDNRKAEFMRTGQEPNKDEE